MQFVSNTIFATLVILLLGNFSCSPSRAINTKQESIRFASYNVALYRKTAGQLGNDLASGEDVQIQKVAAIIQHTRPDVVALLEFDYDPSGKLLDDFCENYLEKNQYGQKSIDYKYRIQFPSNTGIPANVDLNNDGKIALPNDAFGYGAYPGQYAFCLLSKYPIDTSQIRTFQNFRWIDLPDYQQVLVKDTSSYYSPEALAMFRLSSKNHVIVPVQLPGGKIIQTIISHPTPPVFDGPEDRNGLRNYDEIRLIKEIISGSDFLEDDRGRKGGLNKSDAFVILGDLNADPIDGDSAPGAINQLLNSPLINPSTATGNLIPASNGGKENNKATNDKADPAFDTSFFGKRIDYVLLSRNLKALASGVFWPGQTEALHDLVKDKSASDHLLVWVDLEIE